VLNIVILVMANKTWRSFLFARETVVYDATTLKKRPVVYRNSSVNTCLALRFLGWGNHQAAILNA